MEKIGKKLIISILIIVILFNFIFTENVSYADETFEQVLVGILGTFIGILSWPIRIVALACGSAIELLTGGIAYMDGAMSGENVKSYITPFEILFNKVQLLDINFFDFSIPQTSSAYKIRVAVAGWFYLMRLISVSILLLILAYVGIRMALSTLAEEKVKYKKMLVDWIASIALVFVLQYIIIITVGINNALVSALASTIQGNEIEQAISAIAIKALGFSIEAFACTVVYCMLVFQTLSLVLSYINRMIKLAFLIIISPLISITYSIDKMGDGKSQALNAWLKEFVFSILIQPFHCIIYMVFVDMAFKLLVSPNNPGWLHDVAAAVLSILCIKFTKDAEKIVRKIFDFKDEDTGTSLAAGMALSMAAVSNATKIGKTARKGINGLKSSNMFKAIGNDVRTVRAATRAAFFMGKEKEQGQTFTERTAAAKEQIKEEKDKKYIEKHGSNAANSKVEERAKKLREATPEMSEAQARRQARKEVAENIREERKNKGIRGKIRKARGFVGSLETIKYIKNNTIPAGLGFMAASMLYGGNSDLFTAIGTGVATKGAAQEFMTNSTGTIATDMAENLVAAGANEGNARDVAADIRVKGDSGEYDADKFKTLVDELKKILQQAGIQGVSADTIASNINTEMKVNPNFDLRSLLARLDTSGANLAGNEAVFNKANEYKTKRAESNVYASLKTGEEIGLSVDALASAAVSRMQYAKETASGANSDVEYEPSRKEETSSTEEAEYGSDSDSGSEEMSPKEKETIIIEEIIDDKGNISRKLEELVRNSSDVNSSLDRLEKELMRQTSKSSSKKDTERFESQLAKKLDELQKFRDRFTEQRK